MLLIRSTHRVRRKATWGRKAIWWSRNLLLLAAVAVLSQPAHAKQRGAASPRKLDAHLAKALMRQGHSRVIVSFTDDRQSEQIIRDVGGAPGRKLGLIKGRVATVANARLARLADHPAVRRVSLDRQAVTFNGRTAVTIGARAVRETLGFDGSGVGIAVIDSGITGWHDDLSTGNLYGQRVAKFVDFVNGMPGAYDDWGHGTHVAGIAAGNGYDSRGIRAGIAPAAHVVALKALAADGTGYISDIIAAVDWAVANRAAYNIRVINMSLGAGVYESYNTDPLTVATKRAVDAGIVVVAAAGNLGRNRNGETLYGAITAPANAPWVLTVGASSHQGTVGRKDDIVARYSSRGPSAIDFNAKPDLVAPGSGTVSLSDPQSRLYAEKPQALVDGQVNTPFRPYLTLSGTSMAAPVVSGTVALMLQANPSLTPNLVKAVLQFTAEANPGYDFLTQGAGFLNANGAVKLARYFKTARPGDKYPIQKPWSRHFFWGNYRVTGGVLTPFGTAWGTNVVWGQRLLPDGQPVVWGDNCPAAGCELATWGTGKIWGSTDVNIVWGVVDDNIVWGQSDDNIVWGQTDDNIVWGQADENIVWGMDCDGADCGHTVWGSAEDNIVWGEAEGVDNIVWGQGAGDENVVWGTSNEDEHSYWGNSGDEQAVFGDEASELEWFDPYVFDQLFEVDNTATAEPITTSDPADGTTAAEPTTSTSEPAASEPPADATTYETGPEPAPDEASPGTASEPATYETTPDDDTTSQSSSTSEGGQL